MLNYLNKTIAKLRADSSGNAAMLMAIGMPILIGGAGLAVDTAQWYLWKREMQHAVDQAAIGAAWALSNEDSKAHYQLRARQEFDANVAVTSDFAVMNDAQLRDFAGGNGNSVVVSAVATRSLPFSSVIMKGGTTIRVSAQASFQRGLDYNACLVALAEDSGVLDIGGNATVKARCGLAALSCEEDAVVIDGSATVETDSIAACGTVSVPTENEGVVSEGVQGLEDIYADLDPPDNPTPRNYECKTFGSKKDKYNLASLQPGTYKGGINVKCTTVLQSGIYVIDGGELDLTANYNVTGTNVMFILKNGARIKFGGNGNGNSVTLTPMQAADFEGTDYAAQADKLAGMLVFEHRDNNVGNPGHRMNGNSNSIIEGLIYLPDGEIEILGTADITAQCLQISAYKIKVLGNAYLETLCPVEETTSVGTTISQIRLVA